MIRKTFATVLFLLLIPFFAKDRASAFDSENIAIHGFVSQGYLRSSDNNYLGNSKDGSFEFNEIGINFNALLTDELRFGAQLFSRDLGELGNNELTVDWAFLDYTYQDWLGIRTGKIKMPYGLYSRKRDADNLRTSILMPQSVYHEGIKAMANAFYGMSIYGNANLNIFGFLDYEFFGGTIDVPLGTPYVRDILLLMKYTNPTQYYIATEVMKVNPYTLEVVFKHMGGGMLNWNTPLTGLRFRATDLVGKVDYGLGDIIADMSIEQFSAFSVEYDISDILFAAEYMILDFDLDAVGVKSTQKIEGYYGAISWDMIQWATIGASYGEYYPNAKDKDGGDIKAYIPDYWAWQKDITLSVKFNLNEYFCMKLETHFIDGVGLTNVEDNGPPDKAEQNWILYAVKTSLNF